MTNITHLDENWGQSLEYAIRYKISQTGNVSKSSLFQGIIKQLQIDNRLFLASYKFFWRVKNEISKYHFVPVSIGSIMPSGHLGSCQQLLPPLSKTFVKDCILSQPWSLAAHILWSKKSFCTFPKGVTLNQIKARLGAI